MELKLVEKTKDSIKVEVTEADPTLFYPLVSELLRDSVVEDARYITGHPLLDKPVIYVKVKKGRPQTALKRAAKKLADGFDRCLQTLEKQKD